MGGPAARHTPRQQRSMPLWEASSSGSAESQGMSQRWRSRVTNATRAFLAGEGLARSQNAHPCPG